ncbi:alpha/beta-hydrolase [Nadsonia fulvescens var. elongata DSM 6958]|uniref:Carboxypeptidase n=1 Tax=Nadsonia fulvescens var. elongata DSM 6958 TaxID=857566 RepID=A0A1E3PNQ6_9ASCO|nr:alpha/beta-hydrolase [Nadsonia fulvescens var. elongata DSM 6958]
MDGALMEIGPYRVANNGKLQVNNGSWHEYANLLFIDQPFGVGFSYGKPEGYVHELADAADDLVLFLDRFCEMFPETLRHDIYLAGESYAGQYIPYLAQAILNRNKDPKGKSSYNLKGLIIGNGWIDPSNQYLGYYPYMMVNDLVEKGSETDKKLLALHEKCAESLAEYKKEGRVMPIHDSTCENLVQAILHVPPKGKGIEDPKNNCMNVYNIRLTDSYPSCGMNWPPDLPAVQKYLRDEAVLAALNINIKKTHPWNECAADVGKAFKPTTAPSVELLPAILEQVPVLLFNGDMDFICNHIGNEKLIDELDWNGQRGWGTDLDNNEHNSGKPIDWILDDGTLAGWVKHSRNLTYALIHNASHMVPFDFPILSRAMLDGFVGSIVGEMNYDVPSIEPTTSSILSQSPSSSSVSSEENAKIIADATRQAYYKAGTLALVVVIIVVIGLLVFMFKQRRRQRQQLDDNINSPYLSFGSSSTVALASISGIFKSVIGGMSRWKEAPSIARRAHKKGDVEGEDVTSLEQGIYYDLDRSTDLNEFNIESDNELDDLSLVNTNDEFEMATKTPRSSQ